MNGLHDWKHNIGRSHGRRFPLQIKRSKREWIFALARHRRDRHKECPACKELMQRIQEAE